MRRLHSPYFRLCLSNNGDVDGPKLAFFGIPFGFKINFLTFTKNCNSWGYNSRNMNKYIIPAVVIRNETEPSTLIEKFYCTCIHQRYLQ